MDITKYIDHTLLKPDAREEEIIKICSEAKEYGFLGVCVNPYYIKLASKELKNSGVKICAVIGFPLGSNTKEVKAFETKNSIENGAEEVDMVLNIGALKDKKYDVVKEDIRAVVEASKGKAKVKVIIECCLLNDEEKKMACQLSIEAGADFIKTSTGFNKGGAQVEDIKLMKSVIGNKGEVKASGGIRDFKKVLAMINAGAKRIGTSGSVQIVEESKNHP